MKQRTTPEQISELTDEQKEKLREWWVPGLGDLAYFEHPSLPSAVIVVSNLEEETLDGVLYQPYKGKCYTPLLSIGQMIEFLTDKKYDNWEVTFVEIGNISGRRLDTECADALWESVKNHL